MLDLDAIRARTAAASPDPWIAEAGDEAWSVRTDEGYLTWDDHGGEVFTQANATFIAHSRKDVPALLEALLRAQARLAEVETELEDIQDEQERELAAYREGSDDSGGRVA